MPKASQNLPSTTESSLEPIHNPSSLILHNVIINDPEDAPVMVEDDHDRRPRAIEFTFGQSFYKWRHFLDVLKEFAIVNNFEFEHITNNPRVTTGCQSKSCTWDMQVSIERCPKFHLIGSFETSTHVTSGCKEKPYVISGDSENYGRPNFPTSRHDVCKYHDKCTKGLLCWCQLLQVVKEEGVCVERDTRKFGGGR